MNIRFAKYLTIPLAALGAAGMTSLFASPERVALVVGNAAYEHTMPLANPVNDAADMAAKLHELGFEVTSATDLNREALFARIGDFHEQARDASVSLFFYAGHGLQVEGANYLVPVDARLESKLDVTRRAVQLSDVMDAMGGGIRLVFLDACRNNPLAEPLARSMGLSRSAAANQGLAEVKGVAETLIAYATDPGAVAADGEGRNSPFTAALLEHLDVVGLSINDVLTRVNHSVRQLTNDRQRPWTHGSLSTIFQFRPGMGAGLFNDEFASNRPQQSQMVSPRDLALWNAVKDSGNAGELEAYINTYPGGVFAPLAMARLRELVWKPIRNSLDPVPLREYLAAHPNGQFRSQAQARLKGLSSAAWKLVAQSIDEKALQDFLAVYGESEFAENAQMRLETLGRPSWDAVANSRDANALFLYLEDNPHSSYHAQARARYAALLKPSPASHPVGARFKDCALCPEMTVLPAGSFFMGSPTSEVGRNHGRESPRHPVTIEAPFAMGVYEVTFAEWDACVSARGCKRYRPDDRGWGRGTRPVIRVSWDDAQNYVAWLSKKTGQEYRLPSEAEWEYAARAGTRTPFHFGASISTRQANYDGNQAYADGAIGMFRQQTVPVGSFPANDFGLHDMHGNVWEWTLDCWNDNYAQTPANGRARLQGNCKRRILRGGAWDSGAIHLRAADRDGDKARDRDGGNGFRVARKLIR